jgi:hypothetical protein
MVGYGTRYQFEFDGSCKPFSHLAELVVKCKVTILKKGYSGGITTIPHGQVTPVIIDYPTSNDDIFYPIRGSVLSFKVLGGVIGMDSLVSEDETEYVLEYYRGGQIFWTGFVSLELCEEDIFLHYPAIEFKTIDALGSLSAITFKDSDGLKSFGKKSIKDTLYSIFNGIGFGYKFNILAKVWDVAMNKSLSGLSQAYVYLNAYRDKSGSTTATIDILKGLAYLFNAIVYQDKGQWWFIKLKDLAFNQNTTENYNADNTAGTAQTIPVLNHGTDFLIIAEPKRKIRRFYKQSTVDYKFFSNFTNLDNSFTIWNNDNVRIYTITSNISETPYAVINGVDIYEKFDMSIARAGANDPSYLTYFKYNSPITISYFDPRLNDYGLFMTATTSTEAQSRYLEFNAGTIAIGEQFSLSISSITKNILLEILVGSNYYNSANNTWQTTRVFNGGYGASGTFSVEEVSTPYYGDLKIRLYCNLSYIQMGVPGSVQPFQTAYHGFYVNSGKIYANELTTVTNVKNTSIIPETVTIYNGDKTTQQDGIGVILDDSNIILNDFTKTSVWSERAEDFGYKIQELSARNILNQYSDYRNIFTGTIIGTNLRFGAIYQFPVQGALADKKFFPLSMKLNERECTAEVIFMELTPNEIDGSVNSTIFDTNGNIVYQNLSSSKKKIVMG